MFIKLLCTNSSTFCSSIYGGSDFTINEGDIVRALIGADGVRFEYEPNHYSLPYRFEDVSKGFISEFDKDAYNKIYQKASGCKMYFEDGTVIDPGDVTIRLS